MSREFMLDTNTVSALISKRSFLVRERVARAGLARLCVSSLVFGEVRYGLSNNPKATRLADTAAKFFSEVAILSWTFETGAIYGELRTAMRRRGKSLGPLDMLIAAHALDAGAVLVSSDRAFRHVPGLTVEDWTT
jgi:tRNA(fMet)-specific endonuclease VapC